MLLHIYHPYRACCAAVKCAVQAHLIHILLTGRIQIYKQIANYVQYFIRCIGLFCRGSKGHLKPSLSRFLFALFLLLTVTFAFRTRRLRDLLRLISRPCSRRNHFISQFLHIFGVFLLGFLLFPEKFGGGSGPPVLVASTAHVSTTATQVFLNTHERSLTYSL